MFGSTLERVSNLTSSFTSWNVFANSETPQLNKRCKKMANKAAESKLLISSNTQSLTDTLLIGEDQKVEEELLKMWILELQSNRYTDIIIYNIIRSRDYIGI